MFELREPIVPAHPALAVPERVDLAWLGLVFGLAWTDSASPGPKNQEPELVGIVVVAVALVARPARSAMFPNSAHRRVLLL